MKIEKISYVLMKIGNINIGDETVYVSENGLTNDIRLATKCDNRRTALSLKYDIEVHENSSHESDMKIVPVKITYEW